MNQIDKILDYSFLSNEVRYWLIALVCFAILVLVEKLLVRRLPQLLKVASERWEFVVLDYFENMGYALKSWCFLPALLWISLSVLTLPSSFSSNLKNIALLALFVQIGLWADAVAKTFIQIRTNALREKDVAETTAYTAIGIALRVLVWIGVAISFLDNLGLDVSALVAGFGIGGIAVALAVQSILGDLFCSLSILLDKPFVVGDFIIVGDKMGVVEKIGVKSTRIRSLSGEQIIISNSDLVSSRIQNYKRMQERRIVFSLGVIYQTSRSLMEQIPNIIKEAIVSTSGTRFDRAHFKNFAAYSLDFEVVYYVLTADYNIYMNIQQEINFRILKSFEEMGIEFAYPTQTLFVEKQVV